MVRRAHDASALADFGDGAHDKMRDFGFSGTVGDKAGSSLKQRTKAGPPTPMASGGMPMGDGGHHLHPHGHSIHRVDHMEDGTVVHHHAHGGSTHHHPDGTISHHAADGSEIDTMAMGGPTTPYASGGTVGAHPHGHAVTHTEAMEDRELHHHAHGGYTVHYHDGREPTHHHHDGTPALHGGGSAHEYAGGGHVDPGDEAEDKKLIQKGVHQHEDHEHGGRHTTLHLARGGGVKMPGLPSMKKPRAHKPRKPKMDALGAGMPVNRPPRNPTTTPSPRNQMSGGVMPYGVQPSAEPDASDGSAPAGSPGVGAAPSGGAMGGGMKRGGKSRA